MEKLNNTIEEIKSQLAQFVIDANEKTKDFDEETQKKAQELIKKTEDVVESTITKLSSIVNNVQDDERLDSFLDKVKAKTKESIDFTLNKIESLSTKITLDDIQDDIIGELDKLKENDTFKKTAEILKDIQAKINEFLERPDVKEKISKAKITTVNLAEKGVEGLKKVLDVETENKEDIQ